MVVSSLAAPLAGNDYHHDRSDEAELAVVAAHGEAAAALSSRPAKSRRTIPYMPSFESTWHE